jgi:hypothetical protein
VDAGESTSRGGGNDGGGGGGGGGGDDDDDDDDDDDKPEEESPVLHHHFLQHAPSDRSSCAHCDGPIPRGQVRIGRPYLPPTRLRRAGEHSWVSWEHLRCLTQGQARLLLAHARAHAHHAHVHREHATDNTGEGDGKATNKKVKEGEEEQQGHNDGDDDLALLANYFVVPPSVHAGGSGPESGTINKVLRCVNERCARTKL